MNKEYLNIKERLHKEENCEKYELIKQKGGKEYNLFIFHLKRIEDYFKCRDMSNPLMKSDCVVSLRELKKYMDENGWE